MRRILKVFGVLVLLIAIGVGALIAFLPTDRIAKIAADQVREATGRELAFSGSLSPSIFPVLGVEATGVSLSNAEWAADETMISAGAVKVGVELAPLLSGEVKVSEIRLIDPVISLEVAEDGRASWDFAPGAPAAADPAPADESQGEGGFVKSVSLGEAVIENGLVRYVDRSSGQTLEVAEINATVGLETLDKPLNVAGDALWNGDKAAIELSLSTIDAAMKNEPVTVDFALVSPRASASFEGEAVAPAPGGLPKVNGAFSLAAPSPADAIAWATGGPAPDAVAGVSDLDVRGSIEMKDAGASIVVDGKAVRDGRAATVALKAAAGADWQTAQAFDVDFAVDVAGLADVGYVGAVALGGEVAPVALDGRYRIASADPAAAAAWASGAAPEGLAGLKDVNFAGVVDLSDAGLSATATGGLTRDGARGDIDLKAVSGPDWATARAFDVALTAGIANLASIEFVGAAAFPGDAPQVNGRLKLDAPNLRGLASLAGAALPKARDDAFRSLSLDAALSTPGAGKLSVALSKLRFDEIEASGDVALDYGGPLAITANLNTNVLGLHPYMVGEETGASGGPGWSKEPIDLSGLGAITGDFSIRAAGVRIPPKIELGRSDIRAKLRGGKLDLNIRELGVYGGGVNGDIAVDGRNGNAIRANVSAAAIRLLPMLQALADIGMIEGVGRMNLNVAGGGASLHDIMNSLNGDGSVKLTDGALVGYNLAAMVRNVTSAFSGGGGAQRTDFSEVSGTFRIANGVLSNADFSFLGPLIRVVGEGTVDLGGQSMNFRVTPKAVASLTGQGGSVADKGLAFPLIISGPWSNLSFTPDLSAGISSILEDPEGALGAAKGLIDEVKNGGGAAEAAKKALEAATGGGDGGGGAAKSIIDAITKEGAEGGDNPVGGLLKGIFKKP